MTDEYTDGPEETTPDGDHLLAPELRNFPWSRAAGAGVLTVVVEYLTFAAIVGLHPGVSTRADTIIEWAKSVGIILFNAHHVPVVIIERKVTLPGPNRFNLITDATNPAVPALVYLAIPVLALLAAGVAFEWVRKDGGEGLIEGGAIVGVGLMAGYLAVGVIGPFLVATTTTFDVGSVTEGVDQLLAVIMFAIYPFVVASIGALSVRAYAEA